MCCHVPPHRALAPVSREGDVANRHAPCQRHRNAALRRGKAKGLLHNLRSGNKTARQVRDQNRAHRPGSHARPLAQGSSDSRARPGAANRSTGAPSACRSRPRYERTARLVPTTAEGPHRPGGKRRAGDRPHRNSPSPLGQQVARAVVGGHDPPATIELDDPAYRVFQQHGERRPERPRIDERLPDPNVLAKVRQQPRDRPDPRRRPAAGVDRVGPRPTRFASRPARQGAR